MKQNIFYLSDRDNAEPRIERNEKYENCPLTKLILFLAPEYIESLDYGKEYEASVILDEIWWDIPATKAGKRFKYLVLRNQLPLLYMDKYSNNHAFYKRK